METILEQQRRYHEERERIMELMVEEYSTKKATVSDHLLFDYLLISSKKLNTKRNIFIIESIG